MLLVIALFITTVLFYAHSSAPPPLVTKHARTTGIILDLPELEPANSTLGVGHARH